MVLRPFLAPVLLLALLSPGTQARPHQDQLTRAAVGEALQTGDLERAHELLTHLLVAQRLDKVEAAFATGDAEGAWRLLEDTLRLDPQSERGRAARKEIGAVLLQARLSSARELLAASNPRDAMVELDDAVLIDGREPLTNYLRGECLLRMGLEDGNVFAFDDARESFLIAARSNRYPEAWAGAGRALFQSYGASLDPGDLSRALEYARRGAEDTPAQSELAALLSFPPRRNHAEIAFFGYIAARSANQDPSWIAQRLDEARGALGACIGDAPEDSWAWLELSKLWQWEQDAAEERATLDRALAIVPQSVELLARLADLGRREGGYAVSVERMRERVEATPELGLAHWFLANEQLELAIERLLAEQTELDAAFAEAEQSFVRCRELEPQYVDSCRGREALCRGGTGWARYNRGDLAAARDAFASMADAVEGGLAWEYPGKLLSGETSLRFVVGKAMERANDPAQGSAERIAAWNLAADTATWLFENGPESSDLANDAGFVNRDAGVAIAAEGDRLLALALGLGEETSASDEQRAAARTSALELIPRARAVMERSYAAYVVAARLAADDARIVNDAGLILAYYLQRELDTAKTYFRSAIEVGGAELARGVDDPDREAYVTEAVGDAHQNLGVVALTLEADPVAARRAFEKSVEIGPFPRPIVTRYYLPLCDSLAEGRVSAELVRRANAWKGGDEASVADQLRAAAELERRVTGNDG